MAHGIGAAALLLLIASSVRVRSPPVRAGSPDLVALFINVERSNTDRAAVFNMIRDRQPHVVGLAEVDEAWLEASESISDDYPHRMALPRDDDFGIALLSRLPLSQGSVEFIGPSGLPTIIVTIDVDSVLWRVIVTHPVPPSTRSAFDSRNQQFMALAEELTDAAGPTILLGDLNATLWSPYLRDFLQAAGLKSASSGLRAFYTWPVGAPVLAVGLDHCLYSEPVDVAGYRVLHSVGSDHFPISCEFFRQH